MQVAAHQHALAHALPHAYYAANPQAFPEGTLEHLLRGEGDPNDPNHQHAVVGPFVYAVASRADDECGPPGLIRAILVLPSAGVTLC